MNQKDEPILRNMHTISDLSKILSDAGISEVIIQVLLDKIKSDKVVIAIIKSKILIGFSSTVITEKGELETTFTS